MKPSSVHQRSVSYSKFTKAKHKQHRESLATVKNTLHFISHSHSLQITLKTLLLHASHSNSREHLFTSPFFRTQELDTIFAFVRLMIRPSSFLPSQLCTECPLEFTYNLLVRNSFSGFVLLYNLGLFIDHL